MKENESISDRIPITSITEQNQMPSSHQAVQSTNSKEMSFSVDLPSLPQGSESIFVRQTIPTGSSDPKSKDSSDSPILFFLHGAAFTSGTWSELGILSDLAGHGYASYAIDVPGYGQSGKVHAKGDQWLRDLIDLLFPEKDSGSDSVSDIMADIMKRGGIDTTGRDMVVVTASMSGQYAIPLLIQRDDEPSPPKQMVGMITVAPVGTDAFSAGQYGKVKTPVCIVYGENDHNLGLASKKNLIQVPQHKVVVVPQGEHAAYRTSPQFFVQEVNKFLEGLKK